MKAVEGDPARYGLSHAEVDRRRRLVGEVGREVEEMHSQLSTTIQTSDARKGGGSGLAHPDSFGAAADEDGDPLAGQDDGDDGYGEFEQQRQMEMMHEQDEALDGVFQTVGNLRLQADTMGRELEEQAEMLEDTENIADRVGGKLANGIKKVRYVIEKNEGMSAGLGLIGRLVRSKGYPLTSGTDRWSSCFIAVLIFVLILLLILVIVL